jgi:flagellar FliJ protein
MKKFVFSLAALFEVKKTQKDKLQAEYTAAEAAYQAAVNKKAALEQTLGEKTQEYEAKAKKGMTVADLKGYVFYLQELQDRIKLAGREVEKAQREVELRRTDLIAIHKEIKVLEKLYEKQYNDYLKEIEKSETKAVEDILSYKTADQNDDNEMPAG